MQHQTKRPLTLIPQGLTMIVAGFLPVFAIIAMFRWSNR